jgi:hypothetical protein
MNAISEMVIVILMLLLWGFELFFGLMDRNFIIIILSFILLILWFDELFPIKKDLRLGFNLKLVLTVLIVLVQHISRFFL